MEPRAESVDFHRLSPSEIVSPIDIDFLNLEEPPLDVLELEPPRNIQMIIYNTLEMSSNWNFPAQASPSYEGSEPSRARALQFSG